MTRTATAYELETDHLLAVIERMQQAGHTERQISRAIGRALPRKPLRERMRELGARLSIRAAQHPVTGDAAA